MIPPTSQGPPSARRRADPRASMQQQIRIILEQERQRVAEEIQNYPPPIPACDAQFNHLLEQRAHLSHALARLGGAQPISVVGCRELVEALLAANDLIGADAEREIRACLNKTLASACPDA